MGLETARMLGEGMAMDRVQRWDVYDIADELADLPAMLSGSPMMVADAYAVLEDLERRLWAAAERGGRVGPYPEYQPYSDV